MSYLQNSNFFHLIGLFTIFLISKVEILFLIFSTTFIRLELCFYHSFQSPKEINSKFLWFSRSTWNQVFILSLATFIDLWLIRDKSDQILKENARTSYRLLCWMTKIWVLDFVCREICIWKLVSMLNPKNYLSESFITS